jgi:hypothetical protein
LRGVLFDEQHGDPTVADDLDRLQDGPRERGRETRRGLVEHEEARPSHEGATDGQHLLLPPAEGLRGLPTPVREDREEVEDLGEGFSDRRPPPGPRAHPEVLLDGERPEERPVLGDVHQPATHEVGGPHAVDLLVVENDVSRGRSDHPGTGSQGRRLARAVGPDQRDDLPLVHLEVHVVEDL